MVSHECVPEFVMLYSVKDLFEITQVVKEIALMMYVCFNDDCTVEDVPLDSEAGLHRRQ